MIDTSINSTSKLVAAVEKMPAFPKSVQRILELSRDINCSPKELVAVIEKDPVMTMKLLRALNSAYYSFPKQITSVNQAVVYLGLNTIKNMALSFAALGTLPQNNAAGFDMQHYLQHSLTTAGLARLLAQKFKLENVNPADCYMAGLLHDFGKVVFAQSMPEEFKLALQKSADERIPLYLAERAVIGSDHTEVGAMLVEKWQFPSGISTLIHDHHTHSANQSEVASCVFVANQISKQLGYASSGHLAVEELPEELAAKFGGNLSEIIASLGDISAILDEAQLYSQAYRESVT